MISLASSARARSALLIGGCLALVAAPRPLRAQPHKPADHPALADPRKDRLEDLRFVTEKLEHVYSYLAYKQKRHGFDYAKAKAAAFAALRRATTAKARLAAIRGLLDRFHDGHLRLLVPSEPHARRDPAVTHRWLAGKILLTRIAHLQGNKRTIHRQLARGLALARRARGLIVDLRGNPGGVNSLSFDYISRLFASPLHLGQSSVRLSPEVLARRPHYRELYPPDPKRPGFSLWREAVIEPQTEKGFSGPIAVLIDHDCYSACESTALAFKASGKAILYGKATGGGSGNPMVFAFPRLKGARLMVPTWIFQKPNGELLEDNGVAPDVVVDHPATLGVAVRAVRQALPRVN